MAEDEGKHRREIEKKTVDAAIKHENTGMRFALIIALAAITASVICAFLKQPWPASFLGGGGLIGLVGAFIWGSRRKTNGNK